MATIIKGLYRHNKSGKIYDVLGTGRHVDNPMKITVIYEQLEDTMMRAPKGMEPVTTNELDIKLPKGSIWIRDLDDFCSIDSDFNNMVKFTRVVL
jgi:hypothetical protein